MTNFFCLYKDRCDYFWPHFNDSLHGLLDCLKVFAYAMDKKMCEILVNYHDRKDVWPTLAMIVRRGGLVKLEGNRLYVRLRGFKNTLIDYAACSLCEDLNKNEAGYP